MAELTGFATGFPNGTSVVHTTPYPVKVGTRARGTDGSEYVYVDYTGTFYTGMPCLINSDYTASVLTAGVGRGAIGVVCSPGTSDNGAWVQIYGRTVMQVGINGASPSDAANGPTTLGTSAATIFVVPTSITSPAVLGYTSGNVSTGSPTMVIGMNVATDASPDEVSLGLAVTSATSYIGAAIGVFLNYPYVIHQNYGE
jgi:hypothetical protein